MTRVAKVPATCHKKEKTNFIYIDDQLDFEFKINVNGVSSTNFRF